MATFVTQTATVATAATAVETRIPAMPPPPGAISDFDHPETLARRNYIAMCVALPFIIVSFALRCYVRLLRKRTWVFEDCKYFLADSSRLRPPNLTWVVRQN